MSSFGESKAIYLSGNQPDDYIKHNMWQLSRVYPSGMRTDSSNYDPVPLWNVGCQLGKIARMMSSLHLQEIFNLPPPSSVFILAIVSD